MSGVVNKDAFFRRLERRLGREFVQKLAGACFAAGNEVKNEADMLISQPGTGRRYGRHIASSPGEPPASDTGRLKSSIVVRVEPDPDGAGYKGVVAVATKYAKWLEYGTVKMAPRPFLRRALANRREAIGKIFRKIKVFRR